MILIRLVLFPVRLLWVVAIGALKLGWWSAKAPVRVSTGTARLVGLKAVLFFLAGLAIGLLSRPARGGSCARS